MGVEQAGHDPRQGAAIGKNCKNVTFKTDK
jgi:hypothetical protein